MHHSNKSQHTVDFKIVFCWIPNFVVVVNANDKLRISVLSMSFILLNINIIYPEQPQNLRSHCYECMWLYAF